MNIVVNKENHMETITDITLVIHSINRWIIVLVGVVAVVKFLAGWLRDAGFSRIDRGLMSGYTGLLDLQLILGIILLFGMGLERYRVEHAVAMVAALVLAHLSRLWREKPDSLRHRNNFLAIVLGLLLIFAGVNLLPIGWTFSVRS
jgi:hypothetical protein